MKMEINLSLNSFPIGKLKGCSLSLECCSSCRCCLGWSGIEFCWKPLASWLVLSQSQDGHRKEVYGPWPGSDGVPLCVTGAKENWSNEALRCQEGLLGSGWQGRLCPWGDPGNQGGSRQRWYSWRRGTYTLDRIPPSEITEKKLKINQPESIKTCDLYGEAA